MSTPKARIVIMVVLSGATLVVACGSGSDPVILLGSPYESRAGDFAKPTESNQDPSPAQNGSAGGVTATTNPQGTKDGGTSGTRDGGSSGTSGNTSGGTSGTPANCPPCDMAVTCDVTITGQSTVKSPITLVTKNGACVFSSQSGDVIFVCGGTLTSNGANVGTWANCVKTSSPPTNPDAG